MLNSAKIVIMAITKKCKKCKKEKDLECFDVHPKCLLGRHSRCKKCRADYERARYQSLSKEERLKKNAKSGKYPKTRFKVHKITERDYLARVESQEGKCAICGTLLGIKLVIDHCHEKKKIRGLLCRTCNSGLGMFKDSPKLFFAAIAYLRKHGREV